MILNLLLVFILINRKPSEKDNESNILKEILNRVSKNNLNFVDSSARNIIEVLKKYYRIDYCSIFIKNENALSMIASDNDIFYKNELEDHCEKLLKKIKGAAIISYSDTECLPYKSADKRQVRYSYFLNLGDIGAIFIENKEDYKENNFELDFFNVVIKNIGIVLQNCIYQDKISKLAMKDNLTGMYNRNYMDSHIESLLKYDKNLVIAIMDIDHFKSVNDNYGHDFGDLVLIEASNFIKKNLSEDDEIYRWGGEEFILSFSNQHITDVEYKLNSLSKFSIRNSKHSINITVSFGVAEFKERLDLALSDVIKNADSALYESKCNGRNRVTLYNR